MRDAGWLSLRVRLVAIAVVAVTVVLVAGGVLLGRAVRASLVEDLGQAAATRSQDLAALVVGGALPDPVPVGEADEALVQVLRDGRLVGGSANAVGVPPAVEPPPSGETRVREVADLPITDDPGGFVVAATTVDTADGTTSVVVATSLEDVAETLARTSALARLALPVLVLLLGAATWLLVGRALRPVDAMRAEAEAIGEADLDRRLPEPSRRDEVGRLARTLNGMLGRIQDGAARRRRFVADAAHELRTPVASVRTRVEVARSSPRPVAWDRVAADVLADTDRMERLIEQLLVLARVDAGELAATGHAVDIDDVVEQQAVAAAGEVGPTVDVSGVAPAQITGDPVLLGLVVRNLVANARAHAAQRVAVSVEARDGLAVLVVDDDGPGIPTDQRAQVFERFVRLDAARSRSPDEPADGAGLGLAIVADVVAAHGGTVRVGDADLGGARFVVELPLAAPPRQVE